MCMYCSEDGFANDWHLVHLGSRAVGGAGLVMMEASAVEARGRISPQDNGIYKDEHIPKLKQITSFIKQHGAVASIQIAHAGRKANTYRPYHEKANQSLPLTDPEAWQTVAPSAIAFGGKITQVPTELSKDEIKDIVQKFVDAAKRALEAGFQVLEIHGAHGYLIHEFYSPLSNKRTDEYGGSFENRTRFAVEIATAVRKVWPQDLPLGIRLSCSDWLDGGWTIDDSVELSKKLKEIGLDFVDCSSGFNADGISTYPMGPSWQVPFAEAIKKQSGMLTLAVGGIKGAHQADEIIRNGRADMILLAAEELHDAYWPYHATEALNSKAAADLLPDQYSYVVRKRH